MSGNHNQDLQQALCLIQAAHDSGADAVKIQTYRADTITIDSDQKDFIINDKKSLWYGRKLYDLYEEAHTPWEWHQELFEFADKVGITLFSSPFDSTAIDLLEKLKNPIYKIASFEMVDLELVAKVSLTGKPVIMSTGIATLGEISEAVSVARKHGCEDLTLLHCISSYPAPIEEANLRTIPEMAQIFKTRVGLSDHSLGIEVPIAAVALGAQVIEKHFALRPEEGGVDSAFSLSPKEFEKMVLGCHNASKSLGIAHFRMDPSENLAQRQFARSLYAVEDIQIGEQFNMANIKSIRPGNGLHPKYFREILGKKATEKISRGTPLNFSHINFN